MKVTSQISSLTCLIPTFCPANTTEINFLPVKADAAACGHRDSLVVERVIELGQTGVGRDEDT